MYKVKDLLNELLKYDPETELHVTCEMEIGRGSTSSNSESTSFDVDVIDDNEEYQELFFDVNDDDDVELPTINKPVVHILISGEETNYN